MAEETVKVKFEDDGTTSKAGATADALAKLDKALGALDGKEIKSNAAAALEKLRSVAVSAGGEAAGALNKLRASAVSAGAAAEAALSAFKSGAAGSSINQVVEAFRAAKAEAQQLRNVEDQILDRLKKQAAAASELANKSVASAKDSWTEAAKNLAREREKQIQSTLGAHKAKIDGLKAADAEKLAKLHELHDIGPELADGGDKFRAMAMAGAAAIAAAAAVLLAAAAAVVYKLLEAGLKLAIAQTSIREAFEGSISKMVGGAKEAKDIFNTAIKIAVDLGLDKETVLQKAKELVGVGFRGAEINAILRVRADIGAVSEEKANAFQKILEKLKSGKAFTSIDELAEAGINSDAVLKQLSQKLGITVDKVKEQLKAGKIDVQTGIQAIIAAAQGQYGGAGGGAAGTIPAKLQGLKTLFESMFDSVDLSGIKGALDSVKKLFEGPDGEKFKAAVNTLFKTISDIFGKAFTGKEGEARLQRFITGITKVMEGAAVIIESAGPSIISILDGLSKIVDRNGSTTGGSWLESLAMGIASVAGALVGQDFVGALQFLLTLPEKVSGLASQFQASMMSLGSDIISGLVNGIMNMGPNVVSALSGVVQSAITAANTLLGRHSPAKATIDMGQDTGLGYVIGLNRTKPLVANAGQSMAAAALGASNDNGVPAAAAATSGAAGGGGGMTIHVHVNSAPGDSREHAQEQGNAAGQAFSRQIAGWIRTQKRAA